MKQKYSILPSSERFVDCKMQGCYVFESHENAFQ